MAEVTLIVGFAALFLAGFVTWYTIGHRRVVSRLEKVPVETGRPLRVVRPDAESDCDG
ncbi:MAG: hypothetical protein ACLPYY_06795 [Acidimicrobiales bacterium]